MDRSPFLGYPAFLARAAAELEVDPSHARGRAPAALSAMANLCAQASTAEAPHVLAILAEAAALRDRLLVAARAADLMLGDVAGPAPRPRHPEDHGRPRPARPSNRPSSQRP